MQSFLDVSLLAVTGGALLLLVLLLVSFLILNRRCEALDKRITEQDAEITKLQEQLKTANNSVEAFERRLKISDQTVAYLSDHAQRLEDSLKASGESIDSLKSEIVAMKARLDEKVKHLEDTRPENSPVIEARQLLREGMDPAEVASRTGLSATEVEVIAKVIPKAQALRQASAVKNTVELGESDTTVNGSNGVTEVDAVPARHHVASLRARNAYGMSLHRQR